MTRPAGVSMAGPRVVVGRRRGHRVDEQAEPGAARREPSVDPADRHRDLAAPRPAGRRRPTPSSAIDVDRDPGLVEGVQGESGSTPRSDVASATTSTDCGSSAATSLGDAGGRVQGRAGVDHQDRDVVVLPGPLDQTDGRGVAAHRAPLGQVAARRGRDREDGVGLGAELVHQSVHRGPSEVPGADDDDQRAAAGGRRPPGRQAGVRAARPMTSRRASTGSASRDLGEQPLGDAERRPAGRGSARGRGRSARQRLGRRLGQRPSRLSCSVGRRRLAATPAGAIAGCGGRPRCPAGRSCRKAAGRCTGSARSARSSG